VSASAAKRVRPTLNDQDPKVVEADLLMITRKSDTGLLLTPGDTAGKRPASAHDLAKPTTSCGGQRVEIERQQRSEVLHVVRLVAAHQPDRDHLADPGR
jgi:hypothetical protein